MKNSSLTVSEARANQYLGERYGQSPEAQAKYGEAIMACSSIEHLGMTVAEIARLYGVDTESLRNQLKRHFPNVIPLRDKLRGLMGYRVHPRAGLQPVTTERYAQAVEKLWDTDMTVKEVASQCGVSYQGLQQYLLFYHKDIAEKRQGRLGFHGHGAAGGLSFYLGIDPRIPLRHAHDDSRTRHGSDSER